MTLGEIDRLPPLGASAEAVTAPFAETTLPSGLRVCAVRVPSVPMIEMRLSVPFGGDDTRHPAVAELMAECLLAGTRVRDRERLDTDLAVIGGDLGAVVDPERVSVGGSVLAEHLGTFLDIVADVLAGAAFPDAELTGERARLVERLRVYRARPGVAARAALLRHAFGDHPAAREVPEPADVATVAAGEVRDLHARRFVPDGATLTLVGDLDLDEAMTMVARRLERWGGDAPAVPVRPFGGPRIGPFAIVDRDGGVQSQIRLLGRGVGRAESEYPAAKLANLVFAGYFSSRLMENVREDKGYTYGVSSGLDSSAAGDMLLVSMDSARETSAAAVLETLYELSRMVIAPPTESEIESARRYAMGGLAISLSTQAGLAGSLAFLSSLGPAVGSGLPWLRKHARDLEEVAVDDVRRAAGKIFGPRRMTGIVQGDAELLSGQLGAVMEVEPWMT